MTSSNIQIPIKVLVHKQQERVLFAEANSDFVDILFSYLTMPMGTIVRLLSNQSNSSQPLVIGSFINLYRSIVNLEAKYFATEACKDMLLNTRNVAEAECRKLKINIDDIKPVEYFICEDINCSAYLSFYRNVKCPKCSKFLNVKTNYQSLRMTARIVGGQEGVFVSSMASFLITDNLRVIPNIPASIYAILYNSGFADFGSFEEKTFNIGSAEILNLLKYSFLSKTPLTTLFLAKNYTMIDESVQTFSPPVVIDGFNNFKKMTVNVLVHKSSNRILLAFSSKDFIDFLFDLFNVPLGRVASLLREFYNPALCVENMYQSVSNLNVGQVFKSQEIKDMLLCPQLAMLSLCPNQLFPPNGERIQKYSLRKLYSSSGKFYNRCLTTDSASVNHELNLASPLCDGELLAGSTTFMVTDDLVVTPLSSMSCIKYLRSMNISPSDTEMQVIDIGKKEAISLLRASLTSTSVLTNGLKHLMHIYP